MFVAEKLKWKFLTKKIDTTDIYIYLYNCDINKCFSIIKALYIPIFLSLKKYI